MGVRCEANLRELLDIPEDYSVLWVQGGATMQMAMAPLNLTSADDTVDYVLTGSWGKKAANEPEPEKSNSSDSDEVQIPPEKFTEIDATLGKIFAAEPSFNPLSA